MRGEADLQALQWAAPMGPNVLTLSLRGGIREAPSHVPGGSPTSWVSPQVILNYPQPPCPPGTYSDAKEWPTSLTRGERPRKHTIEGL